MNKSLITVAAIVVIAVAGWSWNESRYYDAPTTPALNVIDAEGNVVGEYRPPLARDMLAEEKFDSIVYGMRLLNETHTINNRVEFFFSQHVSCQRRAILTYNITFSINHI